MKRVSAQRLLVVYLPPVLVLVVIAFISGFFRVRIPDMTRDMSAIAEIHPLTGFLSNLGILVWCAAAAIAAFAATCLRRTGPRDAFWFLFFSALLSAYLMLDDFFQIHEDLALRYLGLGEKVVFAALGIAVCAYFIAFRRTLFRTNITYLLLAIGFLVGSAAVDVIFGFWPGLLGDWEYLIEDGAKWLGAISWCAYYVHASCQFLIGAFGAPGNAM